MRNAFHSHPGVSSRLRLSFYFGAALFMSQGKKLDHPSFGEFPYLVLCRCLLYILLGPGFNLGKHVGASREPTWKAPRLRAIGDFGCFDFWIWYKESTRAIYFQPKHLCSDPIADPCVWIEALASRRLKGFSDTRFGPAMREGTWLKARSMLILTL